MSDVDTRRATESDLEAASKVLAAAFADYAWTTWTVDSDRHLERIAALQHLALQRFGMAFGEIWLSLIRDEVHCVAVWMDSSVPIPREVEEEVAPLVADLEGERHRASVAAAAQISGWRPPSRHFYLATIGTRPHSQRRGLAHQTLRPVLDTADREGVSAFLETSSRSNVAFYGALGFEVVGHQVIEGGGPDVWAMLRPPVQQRSQRPP